MVRLPETARFNVYPLASAGSTHLQSHSPVSWVVYGKFSGVLAPRCLVCLKQSAKSTPRQGFFFRKQESSQQKQCGGQTANKSLQSSNVYRKVACCLFLLFCDSHPAEHPPSNTTLCSVVTLVCKFAHRMHAKSGRINDANQGSILDPFPNLGFRKCALFVLGKIEVLGISKASGFPRTKEVPTVRS